MLQNRSRAAEISSAGVEYAHVSGPGVSGNRTPGPATGTDPPPPAGVLEEASLALAAMRDQFANFLELVVLEARRAGLALVSMIALGFLVAICITVAWLGVLFALATWAVSFGFQPIPVALVIALSNLVAAAGLAYAGVGLSRALLFSATRRQVAGKPCVTAPKQ